MKNKEQDKQKGQQIGRMSHWIHKYVRRMPGKPKTKISSTGSSWDPFLAEEQAAKTSGIQKNFTPTKALKPDYLDLVNH